MGTALTQTTQQALTIPALAANIDAYMQQVNSIPVLAAEEEQELAQRLKLHGDLAAAQRLILAHLRFVVSIAKGYAGYGLAQADLIQEGNIGLMKAVKRFDPDHEVRLATYAAHWIRAQIQEFVIRNWRIVKVATTKAQRKLFFNLRSSKKHIGWLKHNEAEALSADLNVDTKTVYEMESRLTGKDIGYDQPLVHDDDDVTAVAPADYLIAEHSDTLAEVSKDDWTSQVDTLLPQALQTLDERSSTIIQRRWLDEDKATLQELAKHYGVSAERIRQIENSALQKLKKQLAELA